MISENLSKGNISDFFNLNISITIFFNHAKASLHIPVYATKLNGFHKNCLDNNTKDLHVLHIRGSPIFYVLIQKMNWAYFSLLQKI
jgi:hypothetical protein